MFQNALAFACAWIVIIIAVVIYFLKVFLKKDTKKKIKETTEKQARINVTGSKEIDTTVLCVKIERIGSLISEMSAEESVELINSAFKLMEDSVARYGGTVETVSQDGLTAFWVCKNRTDAAKACHAALDIVVNNEKDNLEFFNKFGKEISFSAGIGAGKTIVGKIGNRNEGGLRVIGSSEYIAIRLQRDAPKGGIFVSETVMKWAGSEIRYEKVDDEMVTGNMRSNEKTFSVHDKSDKKNADMSDSKIQMTGNTGYTMYFMGCRGSYHVSGVRFNEFGGQTTCTILKKGNYALVVDCGTGLYEAKNLLKDCTRIDVLLSHMHYDHCLGLLDWSVFPKNAELNFYGNFRYWLGLRTINQLFSAPFWPVDPVRGNMIQIPDFEQGIAINEDISAKFYPAPHPNNATLMQFNVSGVIISMMVDCESSDGIPIDDLKHNDILIYDSMYTDEEYTDKTGWGHSTWQEGCRLAKAANISKLILTHHSPSRTDSELREIEICARKVFPDASLARAGMEIQL